MGQRYGLGVWLRLAVEGHTVRRGLSYALIVGAVLIAINHFEVFAGSAELDSGRAVKMALTVLVPYLVSTFSSVGAQLACGAHQGDREPTTARLRETAE